MSDYSPRRTAQGRLLQAAIPKHASPQGLPRPGGLLARGVVVRTYLVDEDVFKPSVQAKPETQAIGVQRAVYCDVFVYMGMPGFRRALVTHALVTQDRGGMHEGKLWVPRETEIVIDGMLQGDLRKMDPARFDGEHVLVGFMDDQYNQPVILRGIPHPNMDIGNDQRTVGYRRLIKSTDTGPVTTPPTSRPRITAPEYTKHRGGFYGIDADGNFRLDLTRAHTGVYGPDGAEPDPTEDGKSGSVAVSVQTGATYRINGPESQVIELRPSGAVTIQNQNAIIEIDDDGAIAIRTIAPKEVLVWGDTVKLLASGKADIDAGSVDVGSGAVESAVKGDTWLAEHSQYDSAVVLLLGNIAAVIAAMIVDGTIAPTDSAAAAAATLAGSLTANLATIATFTGKAHLSGTVNVAD